MGYVEAETLQTPTSTNSPSTDSTPPQNRSIDSLSLQSEYDVIEMALLEWSSAGCGHLEGVIVANEKHHHRDNSSSSSSSGPSSPSSDTDVSPSPTLTLDDTDIDTSDSEFTFEYSAQTLPESEDQIYDSNYFPMRKHTDNWLDPYSTGSVRSFLGDLTMTSDERDLLMELLPEGMLGNGMS